MFTEDPQYRMKKDLVIGMLWLLFMVEYSSMVSKAFADNFQLMLSEDASRFCSTAPDSSSTPPTNLCMNGETCAGNEEEFVPALSYIPGLPVMKVKYCLIWDKHT